MKKIYLISLLSLFAMSSVSAQETTVLPSKVKHNSPAMMQDTEASAMYAMPEVLRNLGAKSTENKPVCNLLARHKAINDGAFLWAPLGVPVKYNDVSTGNPTAWQWFTPGAVAADLTTQNIEAYYLEEGLYDMPTLDVTYADGSNSSYTPAMSMTSSEGNEKIKTGGTVEITTIDMRRHDSFGGLDQTATYMFGANTYNEGDARGYVGGTNNTQVVGWGNLFMIAQDDAYLDGVNIYLHHKPTKYKEGAQIRMQVWMPSITDEGVLFTYIPLEGVMIPFEDFKSDGEDGAWALTFDGAVANIEFEVPIDLYGKPYFFVSIEGFSQDPETEDFCLLSDIKGAELTTEQQYNLLAHNSFGRFDGEIDYFRPISNYGGGNGSFAICPVITSGLTRVENPFDGSVEALRLPSFNAGVYNGNIVMMSAEACTVGVYDISGKLVMSAQANKGETVIDAQSLGNGIYVVRASNGNAVKIIK